MSASDMLEEHLSPAQIVKKLGVSRATISRAMRRYVDSAGREGLGPIRKPGGGRAARIPVSAVQAWLTSTEVNG